MKTNIVIDRGTCEGRHFTQWRIDLLDELLGYVSNGFGEAKGVAVNNARTWYDSEEDFHMLSYESGGKNFVIRLYKVFSSKIDGDDEWVGCPRRNILDFAKSLREAVSQ